MPRPIKIGDKWKTNLDMPCNGVLCPRPAIPLPHKHRKRLSFESKEACEQKIAELQRARKELRHGVPRGEISWLAFKEKFAPYSKSKHPNTQTWDRLSVAYLEELYPISQLKQVTPELLGHLKQRLIERGKNPWTINRVLSALLAMMRIAEQWRLVEPQIWRSVSRIKTAKGRLLFWNEDEISALYGRCKGIWETVARLSVQAGLRRAEILNLKFSNVDFERNRIHIVGDDTWHPKNYERRIVPIKETLKAHLRKVRNGSEYVLGEKRFTLGTLTNYFRRIVKEAGLLGSLHTGRHTYGSQAAMRGVPLAVLRDRMGHDSVKTTEIYSHLCPDKTQDLYPA